MSKKLASSESEPEKEGKYERFTLQMCKIVLLSIIISLKKVKTQNTHRKMQLHFYSALKRSSNYSLGQAIWPFRERRCQREIAGVQTQSSRARIQRGFYASPARHKTASSKASRNPVKEFSSHRSEDPLGSWTGVRHPCFGRNRLTF